MLNSKRSTGPFRLSRRRLLASTAAVVVAGALENLCADPAHPPRPPRIQIDPGLRKDWLGRWEKSVLGSDEPRRFAENENGEELGWLLATYLNGYYYGYLATRDTKWLDLLVQCMDAWTARGIKEPDGFLGWPKGDGASTGAVASSFTDSMLGEAMALKSAVLMAGEVQSDRALQAKYGDKARTYIDLAEQTYAKWIARAAWRDTDAGGMWVVPEFGFDQANHRFTDGYDKRQTTGFSLPDNKQNEIAEWIVALHDVTGKPRYRQHAEKWFNVMRSRMKDRDAKYFVWNYWEPGGPWDYKDKHQTRHWVGVHPNGGYYQIDLDAIALAFQHKLVFTQADMDKLIATNRDFMWNQQVEHAQFQRIDGEKPDERWKNSPGVLWTSLVPYDPKLKQIFEANHKPDSWGGTTTTPWYLSLAQG